MGMNIKNPETYRLAKELASKTGESLTTAVTVALQERLDRLEADFVIDDVLAIAKDIRDRLPPGYLDQDFDEMLYDEDGLPK